MANNKNARVSSTAARGGGGRYAGAVEVPVTDSTIALSDLLREVENLREVICGAELAAQHIGQLLEGRPLSDSGEAGSTLTEPQPPITQVYDSLVALRSRVQYLTTQLQTYHAPLS